MIVVTSILLVIAFAVVSYFVPSNFSYTGLSSAANQTVYNTLSSSYSALNLWVIVPIVLVAAVIIALIIGAFRLFASSGAAE